MCSVPSCIVNIFMRKYNYCVVVKIPVVLCFKTESMSSLPSSSRESKPKKTSKRKRTVLSIAQKLEIITHLDKGESVQCLMKRFGVGESTIYDVKYNKESILAFASQMGGKEGSTKRKTMKLAENKKLEEAMYVWFIQCRSKGDPISDLMVCEKALLMNEKVWRSIVSLKNFRRTSKKN